MYKNMFKNLVDSTDIKSLIMLRQIYLPNTNISNIEDNISGFKINKNFSNK